MMNLFSLQLIVAALVSLQCGFEASAEMDSIKMDNNLQPIAPSPKRRTVRKFVHILEPPPETIRHVSGTKLELECLAMGKPAPSVEWLRNGEPIDDEYVEESNELFTPHTTSLAQLTSKLIVASSSNGDEYTCVATAGLKRTTATTTVYKVGGEEDSLLIQKLLLKPSKPTIISYYNEVFQDMGTAIVLPCKVHSNSKSQVFWQDSDNNLIYGNSRMRVLPSGDLLINNIRWADMGNFTCTAKNMYGKDVIATFLYPFKPQV